MRPDIGFGAQDRTEGLTFCDHSGLLGRLLAEPHETIKPCRGVPVTPVPIGNILENTGIDMGELGMPVSHPVFPSTVAPENIPDGITEASCRDQSGAAVRPIHF